MTASPPDEIAAYFGVTEIGPPVPTNYNVAPSADINVVYVDGGARHLDPFHWGLVPSWAKDLTIGARMTNARAETVADKAAFRRSFATRRCIVPVDGFYEWKRIPGQKLKQPFYFRRADGAPLAFAGLWAEWHGVVDGERGVIRSTTIVTTTANETMAPIHDRMPVVLPPMVWESWLSPENDKVDSLLPLLVPAPPELIVCHPVSTEVNNARNGGAHLIDEVELPITDEPPSLF